MSGAVRTFLRDVGVHDIFNESSPDPHVFRAVAVAVKLLTRTPRIPFFRFRNAFVRYSARTLTI
jgi:hypothetical protein